MAEVDKMKNWFKRGVVLINDWETEQVDKAFAWLHKIEVGLAHEEQIPLFIFIICVLFSIEKFTKQLYLLRA